jgi:hypothetical protein
VNDGNRFTQLKTAMAHPIALGEELEEEPA